MLSTTISHYCYITARWLPPFFPNKTRIVWNRIEEVCHHSDIIHPSVRACLKYLNIEDGIEIHTTGDLPARSGMGSSSTFTVGLLNALLALQGNALTKYQLAETAAYIERDILKENVGIQDQIAAAYGGLNFTYINQNGRFTVNPINTSSSHELQNHLMLFFTGVSRTASDIAAEQVAAQLAGHKDAELKQMQLLAHQALSLLMSNGDLLRFGELLHESWQIKRTIAKNISPQFVDDIYERGRKAGAIGGKLLGAGGGGHMLFFAKPEDHSSIKAELKDLIHIPFAFENEGSKIIFQS